MAIRERALKTDGLLLAPAAYLSLLCLLSALLSFFVWMGQSIRLDEAQSIWQTSRSLGGVLNVVAKDVHVPLYFIGLHFWEVAFGTSAAALRLFSLVFFVLSVPAVFYLSLEAYSPRVAYVAALVTSVSPFMNWYGSEARMYSLMFLLAALSHLLFIRLWKRPTADGWFWYSLVILLGLFTHLFFVFIAAVQVAFFAVRKELFQKDALKRFLWLMAAAGAGYLAWFAYRYAAGAGLTNPVLERPTTVDFFNVFSNFIIGFQSDPVNTVFLSLWPLLVLVGFTFLARRRSREPETAYLLAASFVPVVLAFLVSATLQPIFLSRYLIICLPSLYILASFFLSSYRGWARSLAVGALAALLLAALAAQAFDPSSPVKEDFRSASAYVTAHATPSDLFVVSAPFITYPVEYYYRGSASLQSFPRWDRFAKGKVAQPYSEGALRQSLDTWSGVYGRLYLLMGYDQGYEEDLRLYMDKHYQRLEMVPFSPGLTLYVYKLRYP
ncbi:MAG TPA: glycosyltransferase family 39 protein [Candidatus Paceibacterota bacterium]|nr:glycosyltransferase family 39 protein [Candidatus Paceibacterota bacterium]